MQITACLTRILTNSSDMLQKQLLVWNDLTEDH